MDLTRRQKEIYQHLCEYAEDNPQPPSLDELCRFLGMRSKGSLHKHIQSLIKAGLVEPMSRRRHGVRLTGRLDEHAIPWMGRIAAGQPMQTFPNPEWISVPPQLKSQQKCYVLEVRGESMIEAGIYDGDWVVIEKRSYAHNGEIVVALVEGENATLKKIEQKPGSVLLHSENSTMEPIEVAPDDLEIQGVLVGLMRKYT